MAYIIFLTSGKRGVRKTTVSSTLEIGFAKKGKNYSH